MLNYFTLFFVLLISSCVDKSQDLNSLNHPKTELQTASQSVIPPPCKSILNMEHLYGEVKRMEQTTSHARLNGKAVTKIANGNKYSLMFDRYGNALQRHYYNSAGTEETFVLYIMNGSNHLIKSTVYSSSKQILKNIFYQTDTTGKLVQEKCLSPQGVKLYESRFMYQPDGRLSIEEKTSLNANDNLTTRYTYNAKGDCIQTDFYKKSNLLFIQSKSTYTKFDSIGNWLTCIEQTNKGSVFLIERVIEYY